MLRLLLLLNEDDEDSLWSQWWWWCGYQSKISVNIELRLVRKLATTITVELFCLSSAGDNSKQSIIMLCAKTVQKTWIFQIGDYRRHQPEEDQTDKRWTELLDNNKLKSHHHTVLLHQRRQQVDDTNDVWKRFGANNQKNVYCWKGQKITEINLNCLFICRIGFVCLLVGWFVAKSVSYCWPRFWSYRHIIDRSIYPTTHPSIHCCWKLPKVFPFFIC